MPTACSLLSLKPLGKPQGKHLQFDTKLVFNCHVCPHLGDFSSFPVWPGSDSKCNQWQTHAKTKDIEG